VQILESFKNNPLTFWKDLVIPDPDFKFLLIDKTGEVYEVHNSMVLVRIEDKHAAIGCGRDYAMAIMQAGGTSEQACHIASRLNAACGAELDTLSFVEKAEKDSATVAVKPFNRATKKGK
jgi:ATP-dependent protease HslVU (ClpYQ) peptidase subunit